MHDLDALLLSEFPVEHELIYLNHAAVAPIPQRTALAIQAFAEECNTRGAAAYAQWLRVEQTLREQLAALITTDAEDIGLVKNTSEGLSMIAHGFPWRSGDNVVVAAEEFPSNRLVWDSLAPYGVSVRTVAISAADEPEETLIAAANERTRLLSVSTVQYATGLRINLERLGHLCRERNIAFCVDAIQGLGVVLHDVHGMAIDFLVADGHKWLLGPEGLAVFYCHPAWRERLSLHEFGWHMTEDHLNFDQRVWRPATSARRFECGSPNMLGIHALSASLSLLLDVGTEEIERRVLARSEHLASLIARHPRLELLTRMERGRYAGIVSFRHRSMSAGDLFKTLQARKVICAQRGEGVRLSPHAYNRFETLEAAIAAIE